MSYPKIAGRAMPWQSLYLYLFILVMAQRIQYYPPVKISHSIDEKKVIGKVCLHAYSKMKGTHLKAVNNKGEDTGCLRESTFIVNLSTETRKRNMNQK